MQLYSKPCFHSRRNICSQSSSNITPSWSLLLLLLQSNSSFYIKLNNIWPPQETSDIFCACSKSTFSSFFHSDDSKFLCTIASLCAGLSKALKKCRRQWFTQKSEMEPNTDMSWKPRRIVWSRLRWQFSKLFLKISPASSFSVHSKQDRSVLHWWWPVLWKGPALSS